MKILFDQLSYEVSQRITSNYSTSFSLATKMLSPKIRPAIHAIYGFVRLADEIVDSFHGFAKKDLLDELERDLQIALDRKISLNPILNSFQEVVRTYNIEYELIDTFLNSMRSDLYQQDYKNFTTYMQYIYGSADVVGLMCLKVFVNGDEQLYQQLQYSAQKLGSAFQKVNFLRDLKDDTQLLNRSYFPHLTLKGNGLTYAVKHEIISEIEDDFKEALKGIVLLPGEARFGVYTAFLYYKRLLKKLKKTRPDKIMDRRIRISNPIKIGLLAQSFLNYKLNLL